LSFSFAMSSLTISLNFAFLFSFLYYFQSQSIFLLFYLGLHFHYINLHRQKACMLWNTTNSHKKQKLPRPTHYSHQILGKTNVLSPLVLQVPLLCQAAWKVYHILWRNCHQDYCRIPDGSYSTWMVLIWFWLCKIHPFHSFGRDLFLSRSSLCAYHTTLSFKDHSNTNMLH